MRTILAALGLWLAAFLATAPAHAQLNGCQPGLCNLSYALGDTTTFNPATKSANITLSNGNLTLVATATASGQVTAATVSRSTGKYYAEFTVSGSQGDDGLGVGILNSSQALGSVNYLGVDTNSIGYYDGGSVYFAGDTLTTLATYTTDDVIGMAVDIGNKTIWWRVNGGFWNNSATASPALNIGGISVSTIPTAYLAGADAEDQGGGQTANFGKTSFIYGAPLGFVGW